MIAAKAFDPVLGVDIHIIQPPGPVPPVPIPHPFIGILLDPFDFAPIIGSTVSVNGLPRATAGTGGRCLPPHIPIGGVFVKPPANECDIFMGSSTVLADDEPFSFLGMPAISCHCIGMPPIPRLKKKRRVKSLVLPTTVVLAIPMGAPVLVGGPPTISMMALGMKAGMALLGAAFKKLMKTKLARRIKDKFKRKAKAQNAKCDRPGEPVDPVTGHAALELLDFVVAGSPEIRWERYYNSGWSETQGPLGYGFRHSFHHELRVAETHAVYTDPGGSALEFTRNRGTGSAPEPVAGYRFTRTGFGRFTLEHAGVGVMVFRHWQPESAPRLESLQQAGGSAAFEYDDRGTLTRIHRRCAEVGDEIHIRNDGEGRITELWHRRNQDPWSRLAAYTYDAAGCLTEWSDAFGATGSFSFDEQRRMTRRTDRNGYTFTYRYDSSGRCIESYGEDGLWHVRLQYELDCTLVTEADGGVWTYDYDDAGTVIRIVDPYGGVKHRVPGDDGRIIEEIDSGGRVTRWEYNRTGRHSGLLDRWGARLPPKDESPKVPNTLAHIVPDTARGLEWGTIPGVIRPAPMAVRGDALANLRMIPGSVTSGRENIESVVRDPLGRTLQRSDSAGRVERYQYDSEGNVRAYWDPDGRAYQFTTTSWNLEGMRIDPLGAVTRLEYTPREKISRLIDANGNESAYTYDRKDRIISVARNGGTRERYVYDVGDRLTEKRDGRGSLLLSFEIGPNGLHSQRRLASGAVHTYRYDPLGNFIEASTEAAKVLLDYDALGHLTRDERDSLGVRHGYEKGRRQRSAYFDRFMFRYTSLADGSLRVDTPVGQATRILHTDDGMLLTEFGNGTNCLTSYDRLGRCVGRAIWREAGGPFWQLRYDYSAAGEVRRIVDSKRGATQFEYDAAHRLIVARAARNGERRFAYDPAGNLIAIPGSPALTYVSGNRLRHDSKAFYAYNDRDHLAERVEFDGRRTIYRYDSMDMLVSISTSGTAALEWTADYDGLCRRTIKRHGEAETRFFWDDDRLGAEVGPSGAVRVYVYPDQTAFLPLMFVDYDSLDANPSSGRPYYIVHDQVGLPLVIEDAHGATVWRAEDVDPYGRITVAAGNRVTYNLRFPGHYLDPETGLHYNRFRYYSPELGRYLQSDPAGQSGGVNLYAYPANPLLDVDVLGLNHDKKADANSQDGNAKKGSETETPEQKRERLKKKGEERAKQKREELREKAIDDAIADADASGKLKRLTPEERKWLESDPRHKRLAVDPDGDGSYRVGEAQSALKAEADGTLKSPVRRATKKADPNEAGADIIDGDDKLWDHKDASMGADDIAETANPPKGDKENVLVDGREMNKTDPAKLDKLEEDVGNKLGPDAGEVIVVR